jgi:hypothetical protein
MRRLCIVGCVWVVWLLGVVAGGQYPTDRSDAVTVYAAWQQQQQQPQIEAPWRPRGSAGASQQGTSSLPYGSNDYGTENCDATYMEAQEQPVEDPSSSTGLHPRGRRLTSSSGAIRKLQQAGTTTLRPSSTPTRCLDTLGVYSLNNRLTLAPLCTGSVHQSLMLPVAGQDLSMAFPGDPTSCLDVTFGGTSSGTSAGVSGDTGSVVDTVAVCILQHFVVSLMSTHDGWHC